MTINSVNKRAAYLALIIFITLVTILILPTLDTYYFTNFAHKAYAKLSKTVTAFNIINEKDTQDSAANSSMKNSVQTTTSKPEIYSLTTRAMNTTMRELMAVNSRQTNTFRTEVSFNKSYIYCLETPFVDCSWKSPKAASANTYSRVFSFALFRTPLWLAPTTFNFSLCRYSNCKVDPSEVSEKTDVVLVYGVTLRDSFKPPANRLPHQIYGVYGWESTVHMNSEFIWNNKSVWNNQFNMTISYRTDADVFVPYSKLGFSPKPLDKRPNYYEIAKNKTKTAIWIVSHCETPSMREAYVQEMQKYIDVDIYGGCGKPCKEGDIDVCDKQFHLYKFYLSFENSMCPDYITEKFFKIFSSNKHVIPVVRGGADYDKYFPKNTFINAANFKTAKDLALHLKHLASDFETYSQNLEYNDLYETIGDGLSQIGCAVCEYLNTKFKPHIYDINAFYQAGTCYTPKDI